MDQYNGYDNYGYNDENRQPEQPFSPPFGTPGGPFGTPPGPSGSPFGSPGPSGPPFGPPGGPFGPPSGPPFGQGGQPGLPIPGGMGPAAGPPGPPPSFIPSQAQAQGAGVGVFAVDPGAIRRCLFRFTYLWLRDGRQFWAYPVFVGRRSIAGWRWVGFRWVYFGEDLRNISSFICY